MNTAAKKIETFSEQMRAELDYASPSDCYFTARVDGRTIYQSEHCDELAALLQAQRQCPEMGIEYTYGEVDDGPDFAPWAGAESPACERVWYAGYWSIKGYSKELTESEAFDIVAKILGAIGLGESDAIRISSPIELRTPTREEIRLAADNGLSIFVTPTGTYFNKPSAHPHISGIELLEAGVFIYNDGQHIDLDHAIDAYKSGSCDDSYPEQLPERM